MIVRFDGIAGIDDHYCLEVIVRFVGIAGIDDQLYCPVTISGLNLVSFSMSTYT